jgi:hypothetical protein
MPEQTLNPDLTLSAVPGLLPEDDRAASVIDHELAAIAQGADPAPLIEYVWPATTGIAPRAPVDPGRTALCRHCATLIRWWPLKETWRHCALGIRGHAADPMPEGEARALDGNR